MQEMSIDLGSWQQSLTSYEKLGVRNVLLLTDFSECSTRALDYAVGIAQRYEAQLHLLHCVDSTPFNLAEDPEAIQTTRDDARAALEKIADGISRQPRMRNVVAKVVAAAGTLTRILPQAVKDLDADLIIVGTHGRTGWRKLALGSVAEAVIDQAPCPVLTVGPSTNRTRIQESGPSNILLASAGSNRSHLAGSYALSLARKYRSLLSVVDVLEDRAGRVLAEVSQFEWHEAAAATDRRRTAALRPPAEIGTRSDLILSVADQSMADLIVLAVPENHKFTGRFVSTNSYRIVCGAACPVLTVHAGADRGPGQ
jgi:nucleotide-binding universal stress UspA family protein